MKYKILLSIIGIIVALTPSLAQAMPCGRVPVYCITETKDTSGDNTTYRYEVKKPHQACAQTTFNLGQASPICQLINVDMNQYVTQCKAKYADKNTRVIGLSYYSGGDPANPANGSDKRMYGQYYRVVDVMVSDLHYDATPNFRPQKGCDIITN